MEDLIMKIRQSFQRIRRRSVQRASEKGREKIRKWINVQGNLFEHL